MTEPKPSPTPQDLQDLLAENAALRERNDLLNAVIAHSPTVIFAKDREGRLILHNERYAAAFPHLPASELLGRTDHEIVGGVTADIVAENDRRVREGRVPIEIEEVIPHPDG